ncbi:MAG: hypothetical protein GC146_09790 [Limimaricola sp.]|uniref:YciI family protein n=1 Tax=Limimaricola sp. TaxID=2211665 RepID=UPI001DC38919|nr:YciI family protein [Limimaricola sp.]MBI1417499.1 hypothetical protein [Limimaricola sp.]
MFIVSLTYTAPLADIDANLVAHRAFLDRHFATGAFLASGPKQPRTGGVILATVADRATLERILDEDPFKRQDLAQYAVEEFDITRHHPALPALVRDRLLLKVGAEVPKTR